MKVTVLSLIALIGPWSGVDPSDAGRSAPASRPAAGTGLHLDGFSESPHWAEQVRQYRVEPGVNILINAPAAARFDPRRLTRIVFFTLPNGNTTAQTIGRKMALGVDWHYDIQHIGAQTRRLREVVTGENIVVVFLEADGKSWPAWKSKNPDHGKVIDRVLASVRTIFEPPPGGAGSRSGGCVYELSGHSGGGSFVFAFIDHVDHIPPWIRRISFLDSNYNYSDEVRHGDKLVEWLKAAPDHCLSVICYDDRDVKLNGKNIVSATGGTWRRTEQMAARLGKDFKLEKFVVPEFVHYRGLNGRVDLVLHRNPKGKILHTVLVGPMNGFIHAMTVGTPWEGKAGRFVGPPAYEAWIQPE